MAKQPLPCPTLLRQILVLEDGVLFWRHRPVWLFKTPGQCASWNRQFAGTPVSLRPKEKGYYRIRLLGIKKVLLHRVLFAYHHGRWPDGPVDHRNGNPGDNSKANLREATVKQNAQNKAGYGKTSRFRGVYRDRKLWQVKCSDPTGKSRYIGKFSDELEAALAYDTAARKWHGEFARLNFPSVMG